MPLQLARRGAQGPGGRCALVRAREPREGEAVRPLLGRAQPGLPRRRGREAVDDEGRRPIRQARSCSTAGRSRRRTTSRRRAGRRRARPTCSASASRTSSRGPIRGTRSRRTIAGDRCCSARARCRRSSEPTRVSSTRPGTPTPSGRLRSLVVQTTARLRGRAGLARPNGARASLDLGHDRRAPSRPAGERHRRLRIERSVSAGSGADSWPRGSRRRPTARPGRPRARSSPDTRGPISVDGEAGAHDAVPARGRGRRVARAARAGRAALQLDASDGARADGAHAERSGRSSPAPSSPSSAGRARRGSRSARRPWTPPARSALELDAVVPAGSYRARISATAGFAAGTSPVAAGVRMRRVALLVAAAWRSGSRSLRAPTRLASRSGSPSTARRAQSSPPRSSGGRARRPRACGRSRRCSSTFPPARRCEGSPAIRYVEPLVTRHLAFTPSDPLVSKQWYLGYSGFYSSWLTLPSFEPIPVAVIDSGVDAAPSRPRGEDPRREELRRRVGARGHARTRHASSRASSAQAWTTGSASQASRRRPQLLVAKVVTKSRAIPVEAEAKAIRWAVDNGARVINMSLGGIRDPLDPDRDTYSRLEADAVAYAVSNGVVVVAAVGNSDQAPASPWKYASYPAALPHVLGVSATNDTGGIPTFSNRDRDLQRHRRAGPADRLDPSAAADRPLPVRARSRGTRAAAPRSTERRRGRRSPRRR